MIVYWLCTTGVGRKAFHLTLSTWLTTSKNIIIATMCTNPNTVIDRIGILEY